LVYWIWQWFLNLLSNQAALA